jgi:stage III sporulation protein AD
MDGFYRASGGVLIALILCLTVGNQNRSFSVLLAMLACVLVLLQGLRYLEPVSAFLRELEVLGNLPGEMVKILLKTALIGILTEICSLLCADSGNASLGQALRIMGAAVILWLSLPIFRGLLELVQRILEGI